MSQRVPFFLTWVAVMAFLLSGCSGDGHMDPSGVWSDGSSEIRLASADIRIDDRSVADSTIPPGSGASTLFTVALADPADRVGILKMQMQYPMHSAMGMMGAWSSVDCYDDGTHGDLVAGDGTYSYMDMNQHIGPHLGDCRPGEYVYRFHGTDMLDEQTNVVVSRVTVR